MFKNCFFLILLFFSFTTKAENIIKIGAMADVTGPSARIGNDCQRGYELAFNTYSSEGKVGSHTVKIIYGDNQNEVKTGLNEFKRIVEYEGANAIITTRSHISMAINPLSLQKKIPILGIASHPKFTKQNNYAFRFIASAKKDGSTLAKSIFDKGSKKVAIVTLVDDSFLATSESFSEEFKSLGGVITDSIELLPTEMDFKSLIAKLQIKKPDGIFINLGIVQLPHFIKKVKESLKNISIFSNFLINTVDVKNDLGYLANDIPYTESEIGGSNFINLYQTQFKNESPSQISYSCFVAMGATLQAIQSIQEETEYTPDSLYQALKKQNKILVPDGSIEMFEQEANFNSVVYILKNGIREKY